MDEKMKWTNDKVNKVLDAIDLLSKLEVITVNELLVDTVVALSGWTYSEIEEVVIEKIAHLQQDYNSGKISRTERDENISLTLSLQ